MNLANLNYLKRPADIFLFIRIFFSLLLLKMLLGMIKLPKLLRSLEPRKRTVINAARIERISKFSDFFLHRILRSSNPCLLKSLILFRYLRMMGMDIKIAFGVKDESKGLQGHAWLVSNGSYYLEKEDPLKEYQTIFVYPESSPPLLKKACSNGP